MNYTTDAPKRTLPALALLLAVGLTSCASQTAPSTISSSEQIQEAATRARSESCAALKPEPIPRTAPQEWIDHAVKQASAWRAYCGEPVQ
jgi:hypothetical protein